MPYQILLTFFLLRPTFQIILKTLFCLEVKGLEHLKAAGHGAMILAGNHTGFLDGPILIAALNRPFYFLVGESVLSWPVIGPLLRFVSIVPLSQIRPKKALTKARQYLQQGQVLCIFPEGRLTHAGELGEFLPGVCVLQSQSQAPIIPFAIHGGYEAWPWGKWLPRFRKLIIQFDKPIHVSATHKREQLQHLRDTVQHIKGTLSAEVDETSLHRRKHG